MAYKCHITRSRGQQVPRLGPPEPKHGLDKKGGPSLGMTAPATPLALDEQQRCRVHAVAQAGRLGAVVEDVAEVGVALGALDLVAGHAQAAVGVLLHVLLRDGLPEAGPAGA